MKDLVSVRTFDQRYQAELAQGLLEDEGIDSMILADDCGGQRPDLSVRMNGVQLLVREEELERAGEILTLLEEEAVGEDLLEQ